MIEDEMVSQPRVQFFLFCSSFLFLFVTHTCNSIERNLNNNNDKLKYQVH